MRVINVFELETDTLNPIHIITNYKQPQIDLLLYENQYCLITKLKTLITQSYINKDSHMKHICRRCLAAFRCQTNTLDDHIERCINQKHTNITFSNKSDLVV